MLEPHYERPQSLCRAEPRTTAHCLLQNLSAMHGSAAAATPGHCRQLNRTAPGASMRPPRTWSLVSQDWIIYSLFASGAVPTVARTYVDIGANGPIYDSNTWPC